MNLFKPKEQSKDTQYMVYFNEPYEQHNGSYHSYSNTKRAEEYVTLEEAKKAAKDWAKYYKVYITKVNPIYEYESKVVEFQV
jgi:hypothetical protein